MKLDKQIEAFNISVALHHSVFLFRPISCDPWTEVAYGPRLKFFFLHVIQAQIFILLILFETMSTRYIVVDSDTEEAGNISISLFDQQQWIKAKKNTGTVHKENSCQQKAIDVIGRLKKECIQYEARIEELIRQQAQLLIKLQDKDKQTFFTSMSDSSPCPSQHKTTRINTRKWQPLQGKTIPLKLRNSEH